MIFIIDFCLVFYFVENKYIFLILNFFIIFIWKIKNNKKIENKKLFFFQQNKILIVFYFVEKKIDFFF